MITIQIHDKVAIPPDINEIKCFFMNKCDFLFLKNNGYEIIKYSANSETIESIILDRKYELICYDNQEDCYWAVSKCKPHRIQQLDNTFCLLDDIQISEPCYQFPIVIYCDDCANGIIVNYPSEVALIRKKDKKTIWYKHEGNNKNCMPYLYLSNYLVDGYQDYNCQQMQIFLCCSKDCFNVCIPKAYALVALTPSFAEKPCSYCFYALYFDTCSKAFIAIQYCIHDSDKPIEPIPPQPMPNHCGFYEIIHSIALEEAGISHILNAEGEKIQKAVAISDDIGDLIGVNESVKRTLTQVTLLEGMLYSKLEALVNCDEFSNCNKYKETCFETYQNANVEES